MLTYNFGFSETQTGNVSFCIARISLKSPTCCCLVLHLAFQSCVPVHVHHKVITVYFYAC